MPSQLEDALLAWLIFSTFFDPPAVPMLEEEPRRKKRRCWAHLLVAPRGCKSHFYQLYGGLRAHPDKFSAFCHISVACFDKLLAKVRSKLVADDTNTSWCVSPEERLLVTLRFLATGNSSALLRSEFLLGRSTIGGIIRKTCDVIWKRLKPSVMPAPSLQAWLDIAEDFYSDARFPNCLGALDAKHIRVKKPPNSGTRYYNSNQYFSVVLLAVADSTYRFKLIDIGSFGSASDARAFRASRMAQRLVSNQLDLPEPEKLSGSSGSPAPFVVVADESFGLTPHIMRPFPRRGLDTRGQIFNYRLSQAHRFVNGAFGILTSKWQFFQSAIQMEPKNVCAVIQAAVVLYNFCRSNDPSWVVDEDDLDNDVVALTSQSVAVDQTPQRKPALLVRDLFADYFLSPEGEVSWQMDAIEDDDD